MAQHKLTYRFPRRGDGFRAGTGTVPRLDRHARVDIRDFFPARQRRGEGVSRREIPPLHQGRRRADDPDALLALAFPTFRVVVVVPVADGRGQRHGERGQAFGPHRVDGDQLAVLVDDEFGVFVLPSEPFLRRRDLLLWEGG